jgi:hypothetical protein
LGDATAWVVLAVEDFVAVVPELAMLAGGGVAPLPQPETSIDPILTELLPAAITVE